ncbi:MAG: AMP-binding protein [Candidatus Paceibacterota bacterium]
MNQQHRRNHLAALLHALDQRGEEPAILAFEPDSVHQTSGDELAGLARRLARGLRKRGIAPGDRVALVAENSTALITACLGMIVSGCVAVPLDVQMEVKTLGNVLQDSGAKLLLTTAEQAGRLADVIPENIEEAFLLDAAEEPDNGDNPSSLEADGSNEHQTGKASNSDHHQSWHKLLSQGDDTETDLEPDDERSADDTAVLFYTSGTTGPPKGVPLSHRNLTTQIHTVGNAKLTQSDDRILLPLPLHHVYPLVIGTLTPISLGLPIILPRSLTGPDILQAIREGEATMIIGVPRLYRALYEAIQSQAENAAGRWARDALNRSIGLSTWLRKYPRMKLGKLLFQPLRHRIGPNLRVLASGGSPLDPELGWRLEGLGWEVAIGYGLTETSPLLTMNPPGAGHLDTVGRPIPDVELRIDEHWQDKGDENEQHAVSGSGHQNAPGEGEILARGAGVFDGYWNLPDKTKEAFTEDGWYRTGDLGYLDRHGRLHVTGRASTLIITEQGEKVQPDEVESAYAEAPEIREIGVLQRDGKLVALVVPETHNTDGDADLEKQIREAVRRVSDRLPSYQRLADITLTRKSLPRTRIGKIRRHQLKVRWEEAGSEDGEQTGPLPREEMSSEDRELLEHPAAEQLWDLLAEQFSEEPLTPDASLRMDLGVDSMQWLNLTMQIMQRTGVELDDETLARADSVRDLLQAVREAAGRESHKDLFEDPEQALNEQQRRRLQPLGPTASFVARNGFRLNRRLVRWLLQLKVEGIEHLPEKGPLVIAANHLSHLDPFVLSACFDQQRLEQTFWAAWVEATRRNPLTRLGSRLAKTVPIDPQRGVITSLAVGAAVLQRDKILVWFPEGERSSSGQLQPFKPGLGILLEHYRVPVVPTHIEGTYEAMPPDRRTPRRHPTRVRFGAPLHPDDLEKEGEGDEASTRIVDALHTAIARLGEKGTGVDSP